MFDLLGRLFGTRNSRYLRATKKRVAAINALEERMQPLADSELAAVAQQWRERMAAGTSVEEALPEIFAAVREAASRTLSMRHFDCQLIGGLALHQGRIAEMKTGEGKTLVATLPATLNALAGRKVLLVTVNDYLAARDADWMSSIYRALGLTVGIIQSGQPADEKRRAYACDIIYGTNSELGFDYLRDRMALRPEDQMQCDLDYAIIDEVDSILIDEARTPLIISGPGEQSGNLYQVTDAIVPKLKRQAREEDRNNPLDPSEVGDYWVDEKNRQVELTDQGHERVEELLRQKKVLRGDENLYGSNQLKILHFINASLRAHLLYQRDVHYIVRDREIVLIDDHTGRALPGRRLSQGLHQALETREKVPVQEETQTLASTTYQNFFKLFDTLAGMTGTAMTESVELHQIYGLEVMDIPTNKPMRRDDYNDQVYVNRKEKYRAVVELIGQLQEAGRPCLVGTASIESSERLSKLLKKAKVSHSVLNAKNHAKEAEIIAQAGRPGTITIATNMAGRGTDIVLGGNWEAEVAALQEPGEEQVQAIKEAWQQRHQQVIEAGGLYVLGTERHESRRIDNQLRGRSGRQGDPGASIFFMSLEDDLIRIFASDAIRGLIARTMGEESAEAIESPMLTRAIARAQRRVEAQNFEIRKQLLEYDDIANEQRTIIYAHRDSLLRHPDPEETLDTFRQHVVGTTVDGFLPPQGVPEEWDAEGLEAELRREFALDLPVDKWLREDMDLASEDVRERILGEADSAWQRKCAEVGEQMAELERQIMLQVLDRHWKEHLAAMDHLRSGIHLRAYAQRNPRQEYKREAFTLFEALLDRFQRDSVRFLMQVQVQAEPLADDPWEATAGLPQHQTVVPPPPSLAVLGGGEAQQPQPARRAGGAVPVPVRREPVQRPAGQFKVGRNEPCPCGSGKKYKFCHGK